MSLTLSSVGQGYGLSNNLSTSQTRLTSALQALSSGRQVNSAADNAADLAQSTSYSVTLSSQAQALSNLDYGQSTLGTAEGAQSQIANGLQDLNELAVQSGDGILNSRDRQAIQKAADQITQSIDQTASSANFNGVNLLDGSQSGVTLQSGSEAGQTQDIPLGNATTSGLGLGTIDLTTPSGATAALGNVANASQQLAGQQTSTGAAENSLSATAANLGSAYDSLSAAYSRVTDTDYAQAASAQAQATTQQQASIYALSLYNRIQGESMTHLLK